MDEYINREVALARIRYCISEDYSRNGTVFFNMGVRCAAEEITKIPAADVRENHNAEWLINPNGYYPYCSKCKREPQGRVMTDYCPNCGYCMKNSEEDEE